MRKIREVLLWLLVLCLLSGCIAGEAPEITEGLISNKNLTVHFLDVGQADCALLECGGEFALIDGGNVEDSSLVVSYLEKAGVEKLAAVFCSHAHEDHVGGLPGVLAVYPTERVYAPTKTYRSKCFDDFVYYADQQGLEITIPRPGDTLSLGNAVIEVLGPVKSYPDPNNTSLVLMVTFGSNRFLFTGDMETEAENDLLDAGTNVRADVLKVGHHGSNTSSGYRFLYEVSPKYGVISVGTDNSYGHPHEEPMSRFSDADMVIYRTDRMGNVLAVSDGKEISFSWEKGSGPDTLDKTEKSYIGNVKSKVFHSSACYGLPKEENRKTFDSYQAAINAGYKPCSNCLG